MAKSVGQWVGTIVGAVIGFWTGGTSYVALGAAVGGATGGAIDPPKGPKIVWPRLSDLSVQTASYGAPIPRVYGTVGLYGNVVWIENNQLLETEKTEGGGKGGGGKPETTTYSYSVTCAILLCEGPIVGVRRIWAGAKLIYDAGDSTPESIIASNATLAGITIYNGDDTQMPNARMQMTLGAGNVSAWRGKAYVVIEDFQLADYGNSMLGCPFKFEVMSAATFDQYSQPTYVPEYAFPQFSSYGPILGRIESGTMKFDHLGRTYTLSANGTLVNEAASDLGTFPTWGHVGMLGNQPVDFTLAGTFDGWLTVAGANLMYHYPTNATLPAGVWHMMGAAVDKAGTRLYVLAHRESDHTDWLQIYDDDLNLLSQGSQSAYQFVVNAGSYPLVQGTSEVFTVEEGGNYLWYVNAFAGTVSVYPISSGVVGSAQHTFVYGTTPFMGLHGSHLTIAAADAMCWGAHDGGGMFIFSRAITCTPALVDLSDIVTAECLSTGYLSSGDLDTSTLTAQIRGYRIANNSAIRAALEALQAPFPFDVIQDGYKIKFVKRGANSVATVAYDDMAATASAASSNPRITTSREMDAQLPRRIEVTYFDASREYDTGEQAAERLNSTGTGILKIEVPIVMTADEGAQCADMLLYLYHLERLDVEFVVPMCDPYNKLQPADPVTVVTPDATYFVRITSITQESDRTVKITARLADVALYSPTSVGAVSNVLSRPISLTGPSLLTILDIPTISSDNEIPGLVLAGRGAYSGWRGGDVMRSDDGGVSWISQAWISAPGATAAVASNYLGAGPTNAMDVSSVLNVALLSGSISSVSEMALFNGANHFAYGEPGRWEIIAARTVALQSDGTYNLSNLLRGRFGTEWAMTTHVALDDVILLTPGSLNFAAQPTSSISSARQWTILGYGDSGAQQNSRSFTYAGENLECLSPVFVQAFQAIGGDWTINWVRRTRIDGEWRDYVDVAIGESAENYAVEIYTSGAYSTLKRTITTTTQTATYTNAQQFTDFGEAQRTLYYRVAQVSATVGTGRALNSLASSPFAVAIMSFEQSPFTETFGHAVTNTGAPTRDGTTYRFGSYSLGCNGLSNWTNISAAALGPGDFTVEFSLRVAARCGVGYSSVILQVGTVLNGDDGFLISQNSDGTIVFHDQYYNQNNWVVMSELNTWLAVAIVRKNNVVRLLCSNGNKSYVDFSGFTRDFSAPKTISVGGGSRSSNGASTMNIDNLRISQDAIYWDSLPDHTVQFTY